MTPPVLHHTWGQHLSLKEYHAEFDRIRRLRGGHDSYELERRQHVEEQKNSSRDALRRGDWELALRLLEAEQATVIAAAQRDAQWGEWFHRTRIVEEPLTPYVQWHLHALHRLRTVSGAPVRIVRAYELQDAEAVGQLPDLVALRGRVLFEPLHTDDGIPDGAIRYDDRQLLESWERYLEQLHLAGEDIETYFAHCVEGLPAPAKL